MSETENKLEELRASRAAKKAKLAQDTNEQLLVDLEYIDQLEDDHGVANVAVLRVPFVESGVPVAIAVRCPKAVELKRYRDRIKGEKADTVRAAEEIGAACLIYPDKAVLDRVVDVRPGVKAQLGVAALELSVGAAESEGKG